jgi:hypothetical protein
MEVRIATAGKVTSTIAMTTSGRIATTVVVVITTTNAKKKQENRTPSDRGDKVFKPCLVKHTSKECYKTPKSNKCQVQDKICQYEAHHNDARYTSDNNKLRISTDTPVPSKDPASASSESKKNHEDENYHLHIDKKIKAGSHVPCKSDHRQHVAKAQSNQKGKKGEMPPTFFDDDLNFTDTILMGLDSMDSDLNRPDDVTNPFDYDM